MKKILLISLMLLAIKSEAQQADMLYFCKDGFVHFFSSSPLKYIVRKGSIET